MSSHPHIPDNTSGIPPRILALDGGGVRGLSSLLILRELMQRLERRKGHPIRPCEHFDLIVGTGIGGISALFLGRLGMTVEQAIEEYMCVAERAFKPATSMSRFISQRALLDGKIFEDCIADCVQRHLGDSDAILGNTSQTPAGCHTAVLASRSASADAPPAVFRSYATDTHPSSAISIRKVARATTAFAGVFMPAILGSPPAKFMDAGFAGFNNPADIALEEMTRLWPASQPHCFVSLGTGFQKVVSVDQTWANVAEASCRILVSCEFVHDSMVRKHQRKEFGYFRFTVNRGLDSVNVTEWKEVEVLTGITEAWMRWAEVSGNLESCVQVLISDRLATESTANTLPSQHGLQTLPQELRRSFEMLSSASGQHQGMQANEAQINLLLNRCCNIMMDIIIRKQNRLESQNYIRENITSIHSACTSVARAVEVVKNGFAWRLLHHTEIEDRFKSAEFAILDVLNKSQSATELNPQNLRDDIAATREKDRRNLKLWLDKLSQSNEKILAALQENGREPRSPDELLTIFCKDKPYHTTKAASIVDPGVAFIQTATAALQRLSKPRPSLAVPRWNLTSLEVRIDRPEANRIGRGGFGSVYKGEWNGVPVAVKKMEIDGARVLDTRQIKNIRTEVSIWSRLNHPHILRFHGACLEASQPFIVSEYCVNGNALEFLSVRPDADRTRIIYEISLAMEYLHGQDIIHADIKALNVLIGDEGQALLADFGISRLQEDIVSTHDVRKPTTELEGTLRWMAPERIGGRAFSKPSDVYSFAITAWELFTGNVPFKDVISENALARAVIDNKERPPRPESMRSDALWSLIVQCWDSTPSSRPTFRVVHTMLDSIICNEVADGAAKALVKRMNSPDNEEVEAAAREISDMTSPAIHAASERLISAEVLPALLQLLSSSLAVVVEQSVGAIRNLARCESAKEAVIAARLVYPLVCIVSTSLHHGILEQATGAILNISENSESGKDTVVMAGALPVLARLLSKSSQDAVIEQSARIIGVIAAESESRQQAVVASDALSPLVHLLASTSHDHILTSTLVAIRNITNYEAGPVIDAGAVPSLIEILSTSSDDNDLEHAAAALCNIAKFAAGAEAITDAGVLIPLVRILAVSSHNGALSQAAAILAEIASYCPNVLPADSALSLLIKIISNSLDDTVLEKTTSAMRKIAQWELGGGTLLASGALPPIIRLLSISSYDVLLWNGVGIINDVSVSERGQNIAVAAGAVRPLVRILSTSSHNGVLEQAAGAMRRIARSEVGLRAAIDSGAIPPLVGILSTSSHSDILKNAVAAVWEIADSETGIDAVIASGAIPQLVRILSTSSHDDVLTRTLGAIRDIADSQAVPDAVIATSAVPPLVRILSTSSHNVVLERAAGAVWKIAGTNAGTEGVITGGVLPPLVRLLSNSSHNTVLKHAAGAVWEIAISRRGKDALVAEGAIPPLIRLISTSTHKSVLKQAAGAIRMISDTRASQDAFITADTLPVLENLLAHKLNTDIRKHVTQTVSILKKRDQQNKNATTMTAPMSKVRPSIVARLSRKWERPVGLPRADSNK